MKVGSLFAGVGGFDLGFEHAGFNTVWTVEIDPKARAVLRRRFPNAAHHSDITTLNPDDLEPVDVITYGFPCQDLSVAGKRRGLAGERSGLFYHATRIIRHLRPRYSIAENVLGLFSSNEGRDFAAVLGELAELGTDTAWRTLDSQWFGVAQRRRRVFIVTDTRGERAAEILSLTEGLSGHPAPRRETGEGIAEATSKCLGTSSGGIDREDKHTLIPEICGALTAMGPKSNGAPEVDGNQYIPEKWPAEVAGALTTAFASKWGLEDQHVNAGAPFFVPDQLKVRRLTPVECCRLQGFPDDWNEWGIDDQGKRIEMSDSARYKQMGNAVTVNVAHWIASNIAEILNPNHKTKNELPRAI